MSVVGAAMSDYVEPDATDQRSLREFMSWTSEGYVMIHIAQSVDMHFGQRAIAQRLTVSVVQSVTSELIGLSGIG